MLDKNEKYVQLIRQLIPINELPVQIQNEFINKAKLLNLNEGDYLFKKGEQDEYSYYLLEGEIELQGGLENSVVTGGTKGSRYAMAQLQPRQFNANALTESVVLQILRGHLDNLIVLYEKEVAESYGRDADVDVTDVGVSDNEDGEGVDWMVKMLQSALFSRLPTTNIHTLFALLEPLVLKAGDVIIKQGDPGEYYYIIQEGKCQVSRKPRVDSKDIKLAVMGAGDSFGEEALFTEATRNSTVTMITDGIVMQLSKNDFIDLIKKPMLQEISYEDAMCLVEIGNGQWIDVRYKNEYEESAIADSQNIPLNMLRMQAAKFPQDKQYIVYCDTGGRSLSAAFLLTGMGFDVCYLDGGLVNNPQAQKIVSAANILQSGSSVEEEIPSLNIELNAEDVQVIVEEEVSSSIEVESGAGNDSINIEEEGPSSKWTDLNIKDNHADLEKEEQSVNGIDLDIDIDIEDIQVTIDDDFDDEEIDPDVKASVLETELAKTNLKLMDTSKIIHLAESRGIKKAQEELEDKLMKERIRIEVAKEAAEIEARKLREFEEAKITRKKQEAKKKLQKERKKLEQIYLHNAEEMERIQLIKAENEKQLKINKEKLEKSIAVAIRKIAEAQKKMEEAKQIKADIDKSRAELLQVEETQKIKSEELERNIQAEVKGRLEQERRIMAEQIANHQDELETYKLAKAAAEAAREAAKKEAIHIIAEHKALHEKDKTLIQRQLKKERLKLEEDQQKIQRTLLDIQKLKKEAEMARRQANEEARNLRKKQQQLMITMDQEIREKVKQELRKAEEKIHRAKKEIAQAEQVQIKVVAAKKANELDILTQKVHEEKITEQLKVTSAENCKNSQDKDKINARIFSHKENMQRIRQCAAAAKKTAHKSDQKTVEEIQQRLIQNNI